MAETQNDPLQTLVKSPDYIKGFNEGYNIGFKDAENDMSGDYDRGYEYGIALGAKQYSNLLKKVYSIATSWNLKVVDPNRALSQIFSLLHNKTELQITIKRKTK